MSDVLIDLPAHGGSRGRRAGLEEALRTAIRSGRLGPGSVLPSTRALADDLGMSRSTVVAAYEQLVAEGYVTAAQGSATRVAPRRPDVVTDDEPDLLGPVPEHDFRPGEPDPSSFPRARWMRSIRRVLNEAPDSAFGYSDPRGVPELRAGLADQLARTRSVVATAPGVRIVGGYSAALGFMAETLRRRGVERIAVEDPTLPVHVGLLRNAGLRTVPIPVDSDGIDVELLRVGNVGAVVVSPAHQYPTGVAMSAERRHALIDWARATNAWIIEDDYDGEFRYDRRPIGALQGLAPDCVVYVGTASKSLAPALRIAWMVVPKGLRVDLLRMMNVRAAVSSVDQLALTDFIERGDLDRHIRQMRARYRKRSEDVRQLLATTAPWLDVGDSAAGLHLSARLTRSDLDELTVLAAADAQGVGLQGLATHHGSTTVAPGFAIGFSRPPEHHFPTALERLADVLGRV